MASGFDSLALGFFTHLASLLVFSHSLVPTSDQARQPGANVLRMTDHSHEEMDDVPGNHASAASRGERYKLQSAPSFPQPGPLRFRRAFVLVSSVVSSNWEGPDLPVPFICVCSLESE
jgi:hypothetical protein